MEKRKLTDEELDIIYQFINLEWSEMSKEVQDMWTEILIELEKYQEQNNN